MKFQLTHLVILLVLVLLILYFPVPGLDDSCDASDRPVIFTNPNSLAGGGKTSSTSGGVVPTTNTDVLLLNSKFANDSLITAWQVDIKQPGTVHIRVVRAVSDSSYKVVGENTYQATAAGKHTFEVTADKQILAKVGDLVMLNFPDAEILNVVVSETDGAKVMQSSKNNPVDFKQAASVKRSYQITAVYEARKPINTKLLGGSQHIPATSAAAILSHYNKKNAGVPVNGSYWIQTKYMKAPQQLFCNFNNHAGNAYMLVGSVEAGESWPAFTLSPDFSWGIYDGQGRHNSYYRNWTDLDASAVLDGNPAQCARGGFVYNTKDKFCADKKGNRLQLPGGLTQFMLATSNNKYWIVFNRTSLAANNFKPVATSGNFDSNCKQNLSLVRDAKTGALTLSCDAAVSFWSNTNNPTNAWMRQNGGIKIYVGGSYTDVVDKNKEYAHHPKHYRAAGKGRYKTNYHEAQKICSARGKKVCTRDQLKDAAKDGFSKCACGWTSTQQHGQQVIGYPTSSHAWARLQGTKYHSSCGNPGFNTCRTSNPDKNIADVYCCDIHNFTDDFKKLEAPYNMAQVWLADLEALFKATYNHEVPATSFVVLSSQGYGLAVKKGADETYSLANHPKGKIVKGTNKKSLLKFNRSENRAIFMSNHLDFKIKANEAWPNAASLSLVRFGSVTKLYNNHYKSYLSGTNRRYNHAGSSRQRQAYGQENGANLWLIRAKRGLGKLNDNGLGDERARFGQVIQNGDIIRLENTSMKRTLSALPLYRAPVPGNKPEINLYNSGNDGDNTDYWRVETVGSEFWFSGNPIRLSHVNTGKVLVFTSTIYGGGLRALTLDQMRNNNSLLQAKSVKAKSVNISNCDKLLNQLAKMRVLKRSSKAGNGLIYDAKKKHELQREYNTKCRKVSNFGYNWAIHGDLQRVSQNRNRLRQERSKLRGYSATNKQSQGEHTHQQGIMKVKDAELQKLLSRKCLPVKKCVKAGKPEPLAPACKMLSKDVLNGKISDELIEKIKQSKRANDNINNYDLATHKQYHNLIKRDSVAACTN